MKIPFFDTRQIHGEMSDEIHSAVLRVVDSGWYLLGPEVESFERQFAEFHGVGQAVGVASGTDAVELALRSAGIGPGDEVITVSHTATATVCAIERSGAKAVLVDIEPATYTMCPDAAAAAITERTKAILPVHLYGQPAAMDELGRLADRHRLLLVEDCAQALGARFDNRLVGTLGHVAAFSFYPTKNLGACGDAGALVTNDATLAARARELRCYGQSSRSVSVRRGINSRLDEIQAAILQVKLKHLDSHNQQRRNIAATYNAQLPTEACPVERHNTCHAYHLFVIRHARRDALADALTAQGIGTLVHYPTPVHQQPAYADLGYAEGSLPHSEQAAREVLSLPLYPGLSTSQVEEVVSAVGRFLAGVGV